MRCHSMIRIRTSERQPELLESSTSSVKHLAQAACGLTVLLASAVSAYDPLHEEIFEGLFGGHTPRKKAPGGKQVIDETLSRETLSDQPLAIDDPDLQACIDRALPDTSMTQIQTVEVVGDADWTRQFTRTVHWKQYERSHSRLYMRIDKPGADAGIAILFVEQGSDKPDYFAYSPAIKRPRRVTGSAMTTSVLGTDFTYEDLSHFQTIINTERAIRRHDAVINDRATYVLETIPDENASAYSQIRSYLDMDLCVPIKTEFFGHNGSLDKELVIDPADVQQVDGQQIPFRAVMFNHRQKSRSIFVVDSVEVDPELGDNLFSVAGLKKGR